MKAADIIPKTDVRQLIKASKTQSKKIDHPHARYNQLGRISCILCGVQIKSEFAWTAHILSKTHKQNELRGIQPQKRIAPAEPTPLEPPEKVPKNLAPQPEKPTQAASQEDKKIPDNFFDSTPLGDKNPAEKSRVNLTDSKLPEGFFDDAYKDAKVRNVPYKDKMTEELELFQKELVALEKQSEQIVEEETEAIVSGRNLDEIHEQMLKWERIKQLEAQTEAWRQKLKNTNPSDAPLSSETQIKHEPDSPDSDPDSDLDELNDFRTKSTV